ncbi:MAG: hypothetical protein P8181_00760 [bacterium]
MKRRRKHRRRAFITKKTVRHGVAAGGTVTLATLGLTGCDNGGGGVVDPPPPPPLVCSEVDSGQHLAAHGNLHDSNLAVYLFSPRSVDVDTVFVSDVAGAALDSLDTFSDSYLLYFTLESDTTTEVTFTFAGTLLLQKGPCDFSRSFTVTIHDGIVDVAERRRVLPLDTGRDVRIGLVEREGLRVRLEALGAGDTAPVWSVTGGEFERYSHSGIDWRLPPEPGFYQVELYVDRAGRGFGFDALSFEVS